MRWRVNIRRCALQCRKSSSNIGYSVIGLARGVCENRRAAACVAAPVSNEMAAARAMASCGSNIRLLGMLTKDNDAKLYSARYGCSSSPRCGVAAAAIEREIIVAIIDAGNIVSAAKAGMPGGGGS